MNKKMILIVMIALTVLCLTSAADESEAWGAKEYTVDNFVFTLYENREGEAMITGYNDKTVSELSIPETFDCDNVHFEVVSIYSSAFNKCHNLEKLIIPSTVSHIYSGISSPNLREFVVDPKNHTYFSEDGMLYSSKSHSLIECPIKFWGEYVIDNPNIYNVNSGAFRDRIGLTAISFSESIRYIDMFAFQGCISLKTVFIPSSIERVDENSFSCSGLESIILDNPQHIENFAFDRCNKLSSLIVKGNAEFIENDAFGRKLDLGTYTDYNIASELSQKMFTCQSDGKLHYACPAPSIGTIYFDTNGGKAICPIVQPVDSKILSNPTPTKQGYRFTGWDSEIPENMPFGETTLKATWVECEIQDNTPTVGLDIFVLVFISITAIVIMCVTIVNLKK